MSAASTAGDPRSQPRRTRQTADEWLSIQQIADWLTVSRDTVERWVNTGQLRAVDVSARPGRGRPSWRVNRESLDSFLATRANREQPTGKTSRRRKRSNVIEFIK